MCSQKVLLFYFYLVWHRISDEVQLKVNQAKHHNRIIDIFLKLLTTTPAESIDDFELARDLKIPASSEAILCGIALANSDSNSRASADPKCSGSGFAWSSLITSKRFALSTTALSPTANISRLAWNWEHLFSVVHSAKTGIYVRSQLYFTQYRFFPTYKSLCLCFIVCWVRKCFE